MRLNTSQSWSICSTSWESVSISGNPYEAEYITELEYLLNFLVSTSGNPYEAEYITELEYLLNFLG